MVQTPKIVSGPGTLSTLRDELRGPVVLISDRGLAQTGLVDLAKEALQADQCLHFLTGEPTSADVDRAADQLRGSQPTVIGLGGGSALDLAKLAAAVCTDDHPTDSYGECARPITGSLPTVLIPTTAGTGSEMSRTAVFSNSEGRKTWAWGEALQARTAVLDPELTLGLPLEATIYTAVDALSHALEAATAVSKTKLSGTFARQAIAMIPPALERVMKNLKDLDAREELLNASGLAGIALNSCGTGLAHALAHGLGTLVKVPHGLAIAWALRVTLEWNPPGDYGHFEWLAENPSVNLNRWLDQLPLAKLPPFNTEELVEAVRSPENRVILDNNARAVSDSDIPKLCEQLAAYCG